MQGQYRFTNKIDDEKTLKYVRLSNKTKTDDKVLAKFMFLTRQIH